MVREDFFAMRVNASERQLITAVAQRLERNESDAVRLLVREKARELGVLPATSAKDSSALAASAR